MAGALALLEAANWFQDRVWFEKDRLGRDTKRLSPLLRPPGRLSQSDFFGCGIWIDHFNDPRLAFTFDLAGVTPSAVLLP